MDTPLFLLIVTAGLLLPGVILVFAALRYRRQDAPPMASFNPRHWGGGPWGSDYYSPPGKTLNRLGWVFVSAGCLAFIVKLLVFDMG